MAQPDEIAFIINACALDGEACPAAPDTLAIHAGKIIACGAEADSFRSAHASVYAVGDGAVRRVIEGYEAAADANGLLDARHRIENIDTHHTDDLSGMKRLGVVASMQPVHPPGSAGLAHGAGAVRVAATFVAGKLRHGAIA